MKKEKIVICFINFLQAASLAFGVLVAAERIFRADWAFYSHAVCCWPILLCFVGGVLGRLMERLKYILLPVFALISAALLFVFAPAHDGLSVVFLVPAFALGILLYFVGLRGDEPFSGKLALASLLIYLIVCIRFRALPEILPLCRLALVSFLLTLYSFNSASLYEGVHNVKGGETMAIPSGIRGKNLVLLSGFLILCLLLGSFGFLRNALSGAFQFLWGGVAAFFRWLGNRDMSSSTPPPMTPTPPPEKTFDMSVVGEEGSGLFVTVYGVLLCIGCVLFFLFAYLASQEAKHGSGLRRLSDALKRLFKTKKILEYEDDVEKLTDLKTLLRQRREKLRKTVKRLTAKQKHYADMPDDRSRVRYLYRALLRSRYGEDWTPATTPQELGAEQNSERLRRLTARYTQVRYNPEADVPPDFTADASEILRELRSR